MRAAAHIAGLLLLVRATGIAEPEMAPIPDSIYRPPFRGEKDAKEVAVAAFQLDARPVTNGEFLDFVRENPKWRRSQVKRLFADERYLAHWAGDLDPGDARAEQPVTHVSWFAAKAFAVSRAKRLPTTAEWEVAASAGFTERDGANDAEFRAAIARWYATPSPAVLPDAGAGRANVFGVRDLHGLVWEWTSDFNSAMVTGDARGDSGLERQLFCGAGSLGAKDPGNFAAFMRFGFRSSLRAGYTVHNLGFRCARDAENSKLQAPGSK
jgi:formylglycine-generating enzyme required for sulfatase activity